MSLIGTMIAYKKSWIVGSGYDGNSIYGSLDSNMFNSSRDSDVTWVKEKQ